MVNLTIDGTKIEVEGGTTILDAARQANIDIPTLCDHTTLTPYGGCRLCVVEVEGAKTLQPSCTLPAANDMVVFTDTEKVRAARKFVLTMIFSERNHFCPYCNVTGGDCELQNSAYAEGMTHWPIQPNWKPYPVDASHPFIILEHNRCILCRRCVRACSELVGNFTLEFEDRGAASMLIADLNVPLGESSCISCGTCVQVCPTGTLIDRWSAYQGKETEVDITNSICQGCSVGCGINVLTRNNRLVRIEGDWDGEINGGVICDVGRFHPMVETRDRVLSPMVMKNNSLQPSSWEEAFSAVESQLKSNNGKKVGVASTRLSLEALDVFKQFCEGLGVDSIGSTEDGKFTDPAFRYLEKNGKFFESRLNNIQAADCYLVLGEDITKDHQVVSFFVKRNLPTSAKLIQISESKTGFNSFADVSIQMPPSKTAEFLNNLSTLINSGSSTQISAAAKKFDVDNAVLEDAVEFLKSSSSPVVIFGSRQEFSDGSVIYDSAAKFTQEVKGKFISTKGNINSLGASQLEINKFADLNDAEVVFAAAGDENLDENFIKKFEKVPFLVVFSSYKSRLTESANVVLPVENWMEQSGHFLNLDGHILKSHASLKSADGILSNYEAIKNFADHMEIIISSTWKKAIEKPSVVEIV